MPLDGEAQQKPRKSCQHELQSGTVNDLVLTRFHKDYDGQFLFAILQSITTGRAAIQIHFFLLSFSFGVGVDIDIDIDCD